MSNKLYKQRKNTMYTINEKSICQVLKVSFWSINISSSVSTLGYGYFEKFGIKGI